MVNIDEELNKLEELELTSQWAVIPAAVRYCPDIPANAKLIFGEIAAKTNIYGYCFASNQWFADRFQMKADTIQGLIKKLEDAGFIIVQIDQHRVNKHKRHIFTTQKAFAFLPPPEKNPGVTPGKKSGGDPRKKIRGGPGKKSGAQPIENNKLKYTPISPPAWMPLDVLCAISDWCGDDQELMAAWMGYAEMRHRIKKPVSTVDPVKRGCRDLERHSKGDRAYMLKMLEKATDASWRGLYPLKEDDGVSAKKPESFDPLGGLDRL